MTRNQYVRFHLEHPWRLTLQGWMEWTPTGWRPLLNPYRTYDGRKWPPSVLP